MRVLNRRTRRDSIETRNRNCLSPPLIDCVDWLEVAVRPESLLVGAADQRRAGTE